MSFIDCIKEKAIQKQIKESQAQGLIEKYEALKSRFEANGTEADAAAEAAQRAITTETRILQQKNRNIKRAALKQKELMAKMNAMTGSESAKADTVLQLAYNRGQVYYNQSLRQLNEFVDKLAPNFFETSRDYDFFKASVRYMIDGNFDGSPASDMGKAFRELFDWQLANYRANGGVIGEIPNYVPQSHKAPAIRKVSPEKWIGDIMPLLDRQKMIDFNTGLPMTDEALNEALNKMYQRIVTDGRVDVQVALDEGKPLPRGGPGKLAEARMQSRFIHFKDSESYLKYNRMYGVGDKGLIPAFLGHIQRMAQDIGTLDVLGPDPDAIWRMLDARMTVAKTGQMTKAAIAGEYKVLRGTTAFYDPDNAFLQIIGGTQNSMRAAYLGSASVSAMGDIPQGMATAKINGLSAVGALKRYVGLMTNFDAEGRQILINRGFIAEVVSGSTLSDTRVAGEHMTKGFTGWLAGLNNKLSLLGKMTKDIQDAATLEGYAGIAEYLGRTWDDLAGDFYAKEFRNALEYHGITKADWDLMRMESVFEARGGAKFFDPNNMRVESPTIKMNIADLDTEIRGLRTQIGEVDAQLKAGNEIPMSQDMLDGLKARKREINKVLNKKLKRVNELRGLNKQRFDVANKVDDWIMTMRQQASNESTLFSKSIMTGQALGGTVPAKVLMSSVGMFKTFPITVLFTHTFKAMKRAGYFFKTGDVRYLDHAFFSLVGTTLMGAVAMQTKEILKGRTPRPMGGPDDDALGVAKFWTAAAMQGGGLGLFGDFFLQDYSRFGRGPVADMVGPFAGTFDDFVRATKGQLDRSAQGKDTNLIRDSFRIAKRNIPLGSLWYGRLLAERTLLDNMERLTDPKFDARMRKTERHLRDDRGQKYWWRPGTLEPEPELILGGE